MRLPRVYAVLPDAAMIARLVPQGLRLVQLRFKGAAEDVPAQIAAARAICARHGAQLVVNDHWQAALDQGVDFIHLGQEDLDSADTTAIARAGARLGISTHDRAELDRALALAPAYVALGPVWPTRLKKMRWQPQGLEKVSRWKARIGDLPLVAIGGITAERLPALFAAGADVAAVVSDLVTAPEPEARTRHWLTEAEAAHDPL
ncbi:thiamine phosphate synthase [Pararhodobacter aggregans]|uniref:Thiamine-phosphate synthase n=1 Tax=Pararhodobacter aggregans TaxID=404875 RepID=A0A2T7UN76_9RHOB|nr:thiamine phosphate synthase [Pararhodobacter aggregans]PTX02512.1 thiamine-phosphate diphosphorylase [Pararhodobacter aggregans]PVE46116.1 thiamine phosphate synthase [Pararhodobacter aggregans]